MGLVREAIVLYIVSFGASTAQIESSCCLVSTGISLRLLLCVSDRSDDMAEAFHKFNYVTKSQWSLIEGHIDDSSSAS